MSETPTSPDDLRTFFGSPNQLAVACMKTAMDDYHRRFIALSPFVCLATAGADGQPFVSPKGDAPGFVQAPDDRTLVIPDRPGNNKVESFTNIVDNPKVSLIFFVPGLPETLRVLGSASLTTEARLLEAGRAHGRVPKVATRIDVAQVYFHCGKAVVRSKLWSGDAQVSRDAFPSFGEVLKHQCALDLSVDETEAKVQHLYEHDLY